ncbi:MAG: hypothetical protein GTN65_14955, partial [Armatimonadetes bacterium]|nr:hypothetical protein [Armatimonadota bacterium]NIO98361.1 hypothetical protein [Armatimonadota bacterium]
MGRVMHERSLLPPLILERFPWLLEEGDVWLVGGALRDYFLNRSTNDLDFVVAGDARQVARKVADTLTADYFELDKRRGTGRVLSF